MLHKKSELLALLESMKDIPALVVGDIILDRYVWGSVERISQEAPVPVVLVKREEDRLGGAGNVARNMASVGSKVTLCGVVGDDSWATATLDQAKRYGINCDGIVVEKAVPTCVKTRVIAHNQQLVRIDREEVEAPRTSSDAQLVERLSGLIEKAKVVVISDYGKGTISPAILKLFQEHSKKKKFSLTGRPLVLDPNPHNYEYYSDISVAKPNRREAEKASGIKIKDKDSALKAAAFLLKKWNADMIALSLGEDGLLLAPADTSKAIFLPAFARQVFDVSGAGDTLTAIFSLGLAAGAVPSLSGELANAAAGVVVSEVGTVAIEPKKLRAEIDTLCGQTNEQKK